MENKPQKPWWQAGMVVFAEVTGWIAIPIIIALFLGRYLDEKYDSEPWFYLGLTGAAFVVSSIGIVIIASKYIKQIERENKEKLGKKQNDESGNRHN